MKSVFERQRRGSRGDRGNATAWRRSVVSSHAHGTIDIEQVYFQPVQTLLFGELATKEQARVGAANIGHLLPSLSS